MTTLVAIIGAIATLVSALSVGTLIKFFVERKDSKDVSKKQTEENTKAIADLKADVELIKAMSLGSLYDRTKHLAEKYIKRGSVTLQEYDDWYKYLYNPYHEAGGDGTIDKLKELMDELPMR